MTKLFVLPLMLATAVSITGGTVAEAKGWRSNGPGGRPGTIHRPKKRRCTFKRPCSSMPELPDFGTPMPRGGFPDFGTPMPRGGFPDFGTPMPRGGFRR